MRDPPVEEGRLMAESQNAGKWTLQVALLAVALFVLGPLGAHFGVLPPIVGFLLFVIGGVGGLLNSFAGVVALRRGGRSRAIAAIVLSEIPGLLLIYSSARGFGKPAINDITTDVVEPPNLVQAQTQPGNNGRDMVYPEAFRDVVRSAYPDLKPLTLKDSPDAVFARAVKLAQQHPNWIVTYVNGTSRIFEGVATSELFRFQDDFAVRVRPAEGGGSIVDMRSKSRDGKGDLGANAERIRGFLAELSK
jgi:uncharacterized protein (DUF1499 family)